MDSGAKTLSMTLTALGAVLIVVCTWITIPLAVPFTLQTFAVFFLACTLGGKRATVSVLLYILLGTAGLPVFSGFRGGFGALIGPTGGYIAGFVGTTLIMWAMERIPGKTMWVRAASMGLGLIVCYTLGTLWFYRVYTSETGPIGIGAILGMCVVPFILPDLVKIALALLLSRKIAPLLGLNRPRRQEGHRP